MNKKVKIWKKENANVVTNGVLALYCIAVFGVGYLIGYISNEIGRRRIKLVKSENAERCVCCGQVIPEGRQVCVICGYKVNEKKTNITKCKYCGAKTPNATRICKNCYDKLPIVKRLVSLFRIIKKECGE